MTLRALTERNEIREAYRRLTARLKTGTVPFQRKVGYKGGYREQEVYWNASQGYWWLFNAEAEANRYWFCFGVENPEEQSMLSVTVEVNTPHEGVNKRVGGAFAQDEDGRLYIAHTGKVGGGRKGIGKKAFWDYYGGGQVETILWPDGSSSGVIIIAALDSDRLAAHFGRFVREVAAFKAAVAGGGVTGGEEDVRQDTTRFAPEFEGTRQSYETRGRIEANCDHGVIVNQLCAALRERGHEVANDRRDLFILDGGAMTHLFEVKTDISTGSIYQGIGQLMFHGATQDPPPRRILVLPVRPDSKTREALKRLGVGVLTYAWNDGGVDFTDLDDRLAR